GDTTNGSVVADAMRVVRVGGTTAADGIVTLALGGNPLNGTSLDNVLPLVDIVAGTVTFDADAHAPTLAPIAPVYQNHASATVNLPAISSDVDGDTLY